MSLILSREAFLLLPVRWAKPALLVFGLAALGFGGCAQQPQQFASGPKHGKEYFPASVYGAASRRVIEDGQPVPRGGGQYLVGRPYTVAGQTYYPSERKITQVGYASWYGDAFHGRLTANGEIYDRDAFSAAHPTMPLPSYARVTNLANHYSMIVRVNDRGPYASNRVMDVSRRVAEALDFKRFGTAKIKVEYVGRASLAGSDDTKLYATLRQGAPAQWQGDQPVMTAEAAPPTHVASLGNYAPARDSGRYRENERTDELAQYRAKTESQTHRPAAKLSVPERSVSRFAEPRRLADEEGPHAAPRRHSAEMPSAEHRSVRAERDAPSSRHGRTEAARLELAQLIDTSVRTPSRPHEARGRKDTDAAAVLPPGRPSRFGLREPPHAPPRVARSDEGSSSAARHDKRARSHARQG